MSLVKATARRVWHSTIFDAVLLYVALTAWGAAGWQAASVCAICMTIDNPRWRRTPVPPARVIVEHRKEARDGD